MTDARAKYLCSFTGALQLTTSGSARRQSTDAYREIWLDCKTVAAGISARFESCEKYRTGPSKQLHLVIELKHKPEQLGQQVSTFTTTSVASHHMQSSSSISAEIVKACKGTAQTASQRGGVGSKPESGLQLNITLQDLQQGDAFRLHFPNEKVFATVPAVPQGVKLIPRGTVTLHYPVPKGSKDVEYIEHLSNGKLSGRSCKVMSSNTDSVIKQLSAVDIKSEN